MRQSSYRNLFCTNVPQNSYLDLVGSQLSPTPCVATCGSLIAFSCGVEDIGVIHVDATGKRSGFLKLRGLSGNCTDIQMNPLASIVNANNEIVTQLVAGDSLGNVRIWEVATKLANVTVASESKLISSDVSAPVSRVAFNPVAGDTLLVARGNVLQIYHLADPDAPALEQTFPDQIHCAQWLRDGSGVAISLLDKSIRIFDPRQKFSYDSVNTLSFSSTAAAAATELKISNAHLGAKKTINLEMGDGSIIYTTGFGMSRERELAIWDLRNPAEPLSRSRIDQGTGLLRPVFDPDCKLLFLIGQGDSSLRVFEADNSKSPFLHSIANFSLAGEPSRAIGFLPKPVCDFMGCEVNRALVLTASNSIQAYRLEVPRKSKRDFQSDIFPPTAAPIPAISALEWLSGNNSSGGPILASVESLAESIKQGTPFIINENNDHKVQVQRSSSPMSKGTNSIATASTITTSSTSLNTGAAASGTTDLLTDEEVRVRADELNKRFSKFLGYQAKFKYIRGEQAKKEQSFYGLKPAATALDVDLLACNEKFFAFPWEGNSGIFVGDVKKTGKFTQSLNVPLLRGHKKEITGITFDNFDTQVLASCGDDCVIRVWRIPQDGLSTEAQAKSCLDQSVEIKGHENEIRSIIFHPSASGILVTSSIDKTIRVWNLESQEETVCVRDAGMDIVQSLCWDYDGKLMVAACKDKITRILDLRQPSTKCVVANVTSHDGAKGHRAVYVGRSYPGVLTTGFDRLGNRQFKVWDVRQFQKELYLSKLDAGSSIVQPYVIEENDVVIMTGKGEKTIRTFELEGLNDSVANKQAHPCSDYICSGDPHASFALMKRRSCDPNRMEVAKGFRLTASAVEPISFILPRSADLAGYFADDIYQDTRSPVPSESASEWLSGKDESANLMNMNYSSLPLMSARDPTVAYAAIKRSQESTAKFRKEIEEAEALEKQKVEAMTRMQKLAEMNEKYKPNLSMGAKSKVRNEASAEPSNDVEDDEWD